MKKTLLMLACATVALHTQVAAQRLCGFDLQRQAMIAKNPAAAQWFEQRRNSLQGIADNYLNNTVANKTTATASPIPVIFHIIVDSAQFNQLGGTTGIKKRCDSQIAVLNRDFNRQNSDSTLIPAGFKPLYANVGIRFGLAHAAPSGAYSPGYDVKIITATGFTGSTSSYATAKHAPTGTDAWDVNKYLNVWCINFLDVSGLLGLTTPKSFTTAWPPMPAEEVGICLLYNALGKKTVASESYPSGIDKGRTLTHEMGHFFEIWHVWGDDNGHCPGSPGGADDGIADTPPQADMNYGNPALPKYDSCTSTGNGVMCMNYMDYTDDGAMHMFTVMQANVMKAQVASTGENYTLTQQGGLLLDVASAEDNSANFEVYPNPATGTVNVATGDANAGLKRISIINIVGQEVMTMDTQGLQKEIFSIDLSGMSKGIYFVKCNFASGSITRKLLLQ